MLEIFMAICALTMLECGSITVEYYDLPDDNWYGAAGYDDAGNYYIFIDEETKKKNEKFMQRLMAHELAHLMVFEIDKTETTHYGIFKEICENLVVLAEVTGRHTCKPYAEPPPYPWRPSRRE